MRRVLTTTLALAVLAGCFPATRGKALEQRMNKLEQENAQLTASLEADRRQIQSELSAKLAEVTRTMEQLDRASKRSGADFGVQLEQLQEQVGRLQGVIEESTFRLSQLEAKARAAPPSPGTSATPGTSEPTPDRPTDKTAFAALVEKTLAENPAQGRALGDEWLAKWPRDPMAAKIHFKLGESWQAAKQCRAALSEYSVVATNFSTSPQAPDALLRSHECFLALKMNADAKRALQVLIDNYPKSAAAKTAKPILAKMK